MERELLYAPWRHEYVNKNRENSEKQNFKNNCVFCHQIELNEDVKYLIVKRFKNTARPHKKTVTRKRKGKEKRTLFILSELNNANVKGCLL